MRAVKHAIVVEETNGNRILLPAYRYEQDAKMACYRLVDLESVERAFTLETLLDEPSSDATS